MLPESKNGKLLFHFNPMKGKVFSSVELRKALEKGYRITSVHSALQYRKLAGLIKDYVAFFLKMKIEDTRGYTREECHKMDEAHRAMGFKINIDPAEPARTRG